MFDFITNLTKSRPKRSKYVPKSDEQLAMEMIFHTANLVRKNPPTEEELENNIRVKETSPIPVSEVSDKDYIILYYTASWCPPCRKFTPQLADFYNRNANNKGKTFDIVLVSWDNTWRDFANYFKKMPSEWLAVPPSDTHAIKILNQRHNVTSIPSLIVIDTKIKQVVSTKGRDLVARDPNASTFPWDAASLENGTLLGKYFPNGMTPEMWQTVFTVGGGLTGLFVYRTMRSPAAWNNWKNSLANRLNRAAQK